MTSQRPITLSERLLEKLKETPLVRLSDLENDGIWKTTVLRAVEAGDAYNIAPGIIGTLEAAADQDIDSIALDMITDGQAVLYGTSAAARLDLCDAVPKKTSVILPHSMRKTMPSFPLDIWRTRNEAARTLGVTDFVSNLGPSFRITNPARTVVDLYRSSGNRQHARDSIRTFIRRKYDQVELMEIAKAFGLWDEIAPHLEMVTDLHDKGISP